MVDKGFGGQPPIDHWRCVVQRGRQRNATFKDHRQLMAELVWIVYSQFLASFDQVGDEREFVLVDDVVYSGPFVCGLDRRVVKRATSESRRRSAVEECE